MLNSMRERVLLPVVSQLSALLGSFHPGRLQGPDPGEAGPRRQPRRARRRPLHGPQGHRGRLRAVLVLASPSRCAALGGFYAVIVTGLLWAISFFGPDVWVQRKIDERQHEIAIKLPDILDLLVISVEAGLGFEQAIDRTDRRRPRRRCPTSSAGCSRRPAWVRPGPTRCGRWTSGPTCPSCGRSSWPCSRPTPSACRSAGSSASQADEMRVRRRQRAQEQAQKAPVKMLFPLIFCIFPSIFVVILGPAVLHIIESGLG